MKRQIAILATTITALLLIAAIAFGTATYQLTVDGQTYEPTKVVGDYNFPTVHYETPDTDPQEAAAWRDWYWQTWTGNGSDLLPCEFGIHWISNANVLTVSHCLDAPTTTTTEGTTSTTSTPTTTTTEPTTTTSTTTTLPSESTTTTVTSIPTTTSTVPVTTTEPTTTTTAPPAPSTTTTTPISDSTTTTTTVTPTTSTTPPTFNVDDPCGYVTTDTDIRFVSGVVDADLGPGSYDFSDQVKGGDKWVIYQAGTTNVLAEGTFKLSCDDQPPVTITELPFTGPADFWPLALTGMGLFIAGLAVVAVGRIRQPH